MKPATEILLSAAFVLTPREHWFSGSSDPAIDRWCAGLAVYDAAREIRKGAMNEAAYEAARAALFCAIDVPDAGSWTQVYRWNDTHTHAEVLDALYRAAEIAENT